MYRGICAGFVILIILKTIQGQNINCNGKGFYCQNSTHFLICVDMGTGITQTLDNIGQQCPLGTFCDNNQIFECMEKTNSTQNISQTIVPTNLETATTIGLSALGAITPEILLNSAIDATTNLELKTETILPTPSVFDITLQPTTLPGTTVIGLTTENNNSVSPLIFDNATTTVSEQTIIPLSTLNLTVENTTIFLNVTSPSIFPLNITENITQLFNTPSELILPEAIIENTTTPFNATLNLLENTTKPLNASTEFPFTVITVENATTPFNASLNAIESTTKIFNNSLEIPLITFTAENTITPVDALLNAIENTTKLLNGSLELPFTISAENTTTLFNASLNAIESTTKLLNNSLEIPLITFTADNTITPFDASLNATENTTKPLNRYLELPYTISAENTITLFNASLNAPENTTKPFNASSELLFTMSTVENTTISLNAPENTTKPFNASSELLFTMSMVENTTTPLNAPENTTKPFNASSEFSFIVITENTTSFDASLNATENTTKPFNTSSGSTFPIITNTTQTFSITDNSSSDIAPLNNFTNNLIPAVGSIETHIVQTRTMATTETHPNSQKGAATNTTAVDTTLTHALLPSFSTIRTISLVTPFFVKANGECQRPGQYPDENSCHSFYMCHNNVRYKLVCPYNMVYSPSLQKCTPLKDHCMSQNDFTCKRIGRFPDSKSCYSYFECRKNGPEFTASRCHCPWYSAYQPNIGQCVSRNGACCCQQSPQTCPHSTQNTNYDAQTDERNSLHIFYPDNFNGYVQENVVPVEFDIGYYDTLPGEVEKNRGGSNVVDRRWSQPEEESSANDRWIPNYYGSWLNIP